MGMAISLASPFARERSGMFRVRPIPFRYPGISASCGFLSPHRLRQTGHFIARTTVWTASLRSTRVRLMKSGLVIPTVGRILAGLAFSAVPLCAQAIDSNLVGTVTDSSGAAVPKSQVTAANKDTGVKYGAVTDGVGQYRINHLPVGVYDVTTAAQNFASQTAANVS